MRPHKSKRHLCRSVPLDTFFVTGRVDTTLGKNIQRTNKSVILIWKVHTTVIGPTASHRRPLALKNKNNFTHFCREEEEKKDIDHHGDGFSTFVFTLSDGNVASTGIGSFHTPYHPGATKSRDCRHGGRHQDLARTVGPGRPGIGQL